MIKIKGKQLVDELGRTLILRGVNLGGSSKVPAAPNGATWNPEGFFDHRTVSFVRRPFPLEEADEHFKRLRAWGFTFLRFLVTWEAIEHAGPGLYDQEYLDYLYQVIAKAAQYGIQVFIDPHQDVWSRFSGGDGAPGWTFEAIGMDITQFKETGAAIVHATHGDPYPRIIWPSNYGKLANLTMWTLFFASNDFAARTQVDGIPVQEYLQGHYIQAIRQVAMRLKDLPNVAGYDTLNEPSAGMIGLPDLNTQIGLMRLGEAPTAYQAMLLGAGFPQEVDIWSISLLGERKIGSKVVNPGGVSLWMDGFEPVWKQNGVWELDATGKPILARSDHFARVNGKPVDFYRDYFRPFANRYAAEMRAISPHALIFVEGVPNEEGITWTDQDAKDIVHALHWYDDLTLVLKRFTPHFTYDVPARKPVFGRKNAQQVRDRQIAACLRVSEERMGGAPTLIGEVGIPFDMHSKAAYRSGDFSRQALALDATMRALEASIANFTLWNYTADNTNARGDQWNDEDLSLFSRDQQTGSGDIHDGGRALHAAVRPYASKVAGTPLEMSFDIERRVFDFQFSHDPSIAAPTEIFVPNYQYPQGYSVKVCDGEVEIDRDMQTVRYRHSLLEPIHRIVIYPQE